MAKEIMEKRTNRKHTNPAAVGTTRRRNAKPKDRLTAKVLAAEAAGYGCHYGQFVADHPDAFKDWEPGAPVQVPKKLHEMICPMCGQKFTSKNKNRVYCSELCKDRSCRIKKKQEEKKNGQD